MREYHLNFFPSWHADPATNRQLKVLRFFGLPIEPRPSKGRAGSIIGRLFSDTSNQHLWTAYIYTTGDEDASTVELRPHDRSELSQVVIPDDWRPSSRISVSSTKRKTLEAMVSELLKEGSPFDDPAPEITIIGMHFAFTGRFEFGSRKECQEAILSRGGFITDGVTSKTDVLVIGSDESPAWANGNYGNKIEAAMIRRMEHGKPVIVTEAYWRSIIGV